MNFWRVFKYYRKPLRGLLYMPARWLVVPFTQIESFLPKNGNIIDVGCGEGVMAVLLAISSSNRKVTGIDINKSKIKLGKNIASTISNLFFVQGDIMKKKLTRTKGYILSDFLHHIPTTCHKKLLKKLTDSLEKGAVMVIKEIDTDDGLRSKISRFFDFLFYPLEKVYFVNSRELTKFLTSLGLRVNIVKTHKWFPGSTTLFICKK